MTREQIELLQKSQEELDLIVSSLRALQEPRSQETALVLLRRAEHLLTLRCFYQIPRDVDGELFVKQIRIYLKTRGRYPPEWDNE